eukprot:COSAG01_NODE_24126_length_789_cov_1.934783_2_plen_101_part_01
MDIWQYSLIFNQETDYQLKKDDIDCAARHLVDWLVIDYFKFERDDAALPTTYGLLWRLPDTCERHAPGEARKQSCQCLRRRGRAGQQCGGGGGCRGGSSVE